MARIYLIIIIIDAYCLYIAYKKEVPKFWFLVILGIPVFGGVAFLLYQLTLSQDASLSGPTSAPKVGSRSKINRLEKELEVADTMRNRSLLAEEYYKAREFREARQLYESCLSGHASEDLSTLIKLVDICFEEGDYEDCITYAKIINGKALFDKSVEKTAYAWSLYKEGMMLEAEEIFKEMDARYSHYIQRLEFAKFFKITGREKAAQEVCHILTEEYESMHPQEQRQKAKVFKEIKSFKDSL